MEIVVFIFIYELFYWANIIILRDISKKYLTIVCSADVAVADFAAKIIQESVYYTMLVNIIILLTVGQRFPLPSESSALCPVHILHDRRGIECQAV